MAATTTATTSKYVVVLDPGHGGNESGAGAVHNGKVYKEEEINWKIANYTMQALSPVIRYRSSSDQDQESDRKPDETGYDSQKLWSRPSGKPAY